eukprot:scaffold111324_cov44-Prasinocladus_malaysianus.AAC.2
MRPTPSSILQRSPGTSTRYIAVETQHVNCLVACCTTIIIQIMMRRANLPAEVVQNIDTALTELRGVMDSDTPEPIKEKTDALRQAVMKIGESLSKASGSGDGASDGGNSSEGDSKEGEQKK